MDYRLYLLDGRGRIFQAMEPECADDDEAIARTHDLAKTQPAQLWQRARKVFDKPAGADGR